jgi:hypothetical protein
MLTRRLGQCEVLEEMSLHMRKQSLLKPLIFWPGGGKEQSKENPFSVRLYILPHERGTVGRLYAANPFGAVQRCMGSAVNYIVGNRGAKRILHICNHGCQSRDPIQNEEPPLEESDGHASAALLVEYRTQKYRTYSVIPYEGNITAWY